METQWEEGLWLGHARSSKETLIGSKLGVVRAWAIRKKPAEEQWGAALLKEMQATPAQPNPNEPGSRIPVCTHPSKYQMYNWMANPGPRGEGRCPGAQGSVARSHGAAHAPRGPAARGRVAQARGSAAACAGASAPAIQSLIERSPRPERPSWGVSKSI